MTGAGGATETTTDAESGTETGAGGGVTFAAGLKKDEIDGVPFSFFAPFCVEVADMSNERALPSRVPDPSQPPRGILSPLQGSFLLDFMNHEPSMEVALAPLSRTTSL